MIGTNTTKTTTMNNEDFVSYEIAQALARCGYDGQYDYMYATETFCFGNNPISFDTISVGERISECEAYYVNEDNEDAYRGIPCPTLAQAQKWLREKKKVDVLIWNCACGYGWEVSKAGDEQTRGTTLLAYDDNGEDKNSGMWLTYESALSAGITAVLEILTDQAPVGA